MNSQRQKKKLGEIGERKESTKIKINRAVIDQNNIRYFLFAAGKNRCWLAQTDLSDGGSRAKAKLISNGIGVFTNSKLQGCLALAETWTVFGDAIVATRQGWIKKSYILGDRQVFSAKASNVKFINEVEKKAKFCKRGTSAQWLERIAPLIANQHLAKFLLCVAFLPIILDIVKNSNLKIQNPIFDICGESSNGKSTLAIRLLGSVWGWADRDTGFGESWKTTKGGMEQFIEDHNDCVLGLDEANLAGDNSFERAQFVTSCIHSIANGGSRNSMHRTKPSVSSKLVGVNTSNDALSEIMAASKNAKQAASVRILTIRIPENRKHGALDSLPWGMDNSAAAIEAINAVTNEVYGTPIRKFINRLVNDRFDDEVALVGKIKKFAKQFLKSIEIDVNDGIKYRQAKPFALAYAAGRLAMEYGALPSSKIVGTYLSSFEEVWSWMDGNLSKDPAKSAATRLREYVKVNYTRFFEVKHKLTVFKDSAFNDHPGFLKIGKFDEMELLLSKSSFDKLGFTRQDVEELQREGIVVGEGGKNPRKDNKRVVRLDLNLEPVTKRMMVVRLVKLGFKT